MPVAPDLTDRVVVVTGAAGRLGRVVVDQLEDAGARVASLDQDPSGAAGALVLKADVTDEHSVAEAFGTVAERMGTPDAVVHTVGMWDGRPFAETTLAEWRAVLDVNLTSVFIVFREAVRRMAAAGVPGHLVGVASGQGVDRGAPEQAAYSASKAGVLRLVESVAAEHRDAEITATAVAPSLILFGDEPEDARGVDVAEVAGLCVTLCGTAGTIHNGSVMRAYGSMR
ncbi:SDR family NAD(P)-dependent oxidoreductase [Rubrivirga sp. S365]|uniref:SDR family NAD(P)-dependent oxidoreductase n=1 Tax=Rubrivirga litoralis TaxID=3075598 RepID=A0ABU3BLX2_9BACT|nr:MULTISPECIES: SDR family NAD(P)-dependent oxidoreductase [unclassified Rubrivirga]MDT0630285.1 SDR family NAD(P)-dependent oxidoreductase [Rubrivirga sp. F394]MDT7855797.1 SDR family NAD(P)-dependent oxidoreductase [Rubrivirga sp. S365]